MDITETKSKVLKVADLRPNEGQMEAIGVHANPRQISEREYEKLLESLKADNLTGVLQEKVYNYEGEWIVLDGNMRLRALQELGVEKVQCVIVPEETPAPVLEKIIILSNSTFGEWDFDALANEWSDEPLSDWGVDVPKVDEYGDEQETSKLSEIKINSMYHEPENHPQLTLDKCIDLTKYNAKMAALREMDLTEDQLRVLEMFARRFIRIDFESVANYYAFNATEREKDAIERLRLVLVDGGGGVEGYIEDELLRIRAELLNTDQEDDD